MGAALLASWPAASTASALTQPCAPVEVVFARGSGQTAGDPTGSYSRFRESLSRRITAPMTANFYELGSESINGLPPYPAVAVNGGWDGLTNASGAWFSGGEAFTYGDSVNDGTVELSAYLAQRTVDCPTSAFVLGGYSQGAQVVGQAYTHHLSDTVRSRVVFSALFGDPKLYLPEGERNWHRDGLIPSYYAEACRDLEGSRSQWRRTVPNCETDGGSLLARQPYLPAGYEDRTGLWCADHDYVCGSSKKVWDTDGHGTYFNEGGDVEDATQEIAERLASFFPDEADAFDTRVILLKAGTTGLDVVFIIDSTGSMSRAITGAKQFASTMAGSIEALNGRVALVEYRDAGDAFTARIHSRLQSDTTEFTSKLATITAAGGGDWPEATLHALMTAFNGLEWRPGATKAAVVLTDAPFHNPDRVDGSTIESVAARSLEIDPVNVYPVVLSGSEGYYKELADRTSGQVIVSDANAGAALQTALTKISDRPVPLLTQTFYEAPVGEPVAFDASPSYSTSSTIVNWEWDFNGDGLYEQETTEPRTTHTFDAPMTGMMQARATDANGLIANISAPVKIGNLDGDSRPVAPTSLSFVRAGDAVTVNWTGDDAGVDRWAVLVDGVPEAGHDATARTITIEGFGRRRAADISVVGVMEDGTVGHPKTAKLAPAPTFEASLDIMPGSSTNPVNLGKKGLIPVAVLSRPGDDATDIDPGTVCFGDAQVLDDRACGGAKTRPSLVDADGDGLLDMLFKFDVPSIGVDPEDTRACLSGGTRSGEQFELCDAITIVP